MCVKLISLIRLLRLAEGFWLVWKDENILEMYKIWQDITPCGGIASKGRIACDIQADLVGWCQSQD